MEKLQKALEKCNFILTFKTLRNTQQMDKPNLIWETIGYSPRILYTLEPVMKGLRSSLCHDM